MRVLLVEDHLPLAQALREGLTRASFAVDLAHSAHQALKMANLAKYDLVLLDLGLPDQNGLTALTALRDDGRVPVIIMTARDQLSDRLAGLDGGADDYIVKPIEIPELIARCRAVLRRPGERMDAHLTIGPLRLDTVCRSVMHDGVSLALGQREIGVLEELMRAFGRVLPRQKLEQAVYNFDAEITPNALEAAISRVRKALQQINSPMKIITVRGVGWMLSSENKP